jgi:hypothetical protein
MRENVPAMIDIYHSNFLTLLYQWGWMYDIPMKLLRIPKLKKEKFFLDRYNID